MSPPLFANFLQSKVLSLELGLPHIISDNIRADPLPASAGIASQSQYLYDQDLCDTSDVVPCSLVTNIFKSQNLQLVKEL